MHAPSSRMMDRYTIAGVEPRLKLATDALNRSVKARHGSGPRFPQQLHIGLSDAVLLLDDAHAPLDSVVRKFTAMRSQH